MMKQPSQWLLVLVVFGACNGSLQPTDQKGGGTGDKWNDLLAARSENYGAALRSASLRLTGNLPTVAQIEELSAASDPRATYTAMVQGYIQDPRFKLQLLEFFRNSFKMGGTAALDTAPVLAADLARTGSYLELLTAATGTCPTVTVDGTVTRVDCNNGVATHAGLLSNPNVMAHFQSNMGFRRVRWVQETFACTAFPAELGNAQPVGAGDATYTAPWTMESIAGTANGGRIDFLDTSSVVCANCHTTMNHIAPLFANFNDAGQQGGAVAVRLPTEGTPVATRADFLPGSEPTAWRFGVPAADLPALGAAMAADPLITECAVARAWNFALGRGDIVDTLASVPLANIASQVDAFVAGGHRFDQLLLSVFTSDDFLKY